MPYIKGETLRDKIDREKQLSVDESVRIASDVAEALDYAHRNGVVHRDIKPANILLTDGRPVIADFGIALAVAQAGGGRVTETGLSVGTPHYMSPEQATGDRDVDPRADVYALGCVLYEMLVGEPPYTGPNAQAVLARILTGNALAPTEVRPTLPPNVDAAIRRALEKLPADRFASAQAFAGALNDSSFRYGHSAVVGSNSAYGLWNPLSAALAVVAAAATVFAVTTRSPAEPVFPTPTYVSLDAPTNVELGAYNLMFATLALSPDGRRLAYVGIDEDGQRIYLDDLGDPDPAQPIPGTGGGANPFFSPDGTQLGFATRTTLSVVSLSGANPGSLLPPRCSREGPGPLGETRSTTRQV